MLTQWVFDASGRNKDGKSWPTCPPCSYLRQEFTALHAGASSWCSLPSGTASEYQPSSLLSLPQPAASPILKHPYVHWLARLLLCIYMLLRGIWGGKLEIQLCCWLTTPHKKKNNSKKRQGLGISFNLSRPPSPYLYNIRPVLDISSSLEF